MAPSCIRGSWGTCNSKSKTRAFWIAVPGGASCRSGNYGYTRARHPRAVVIPGTTVSSSLCQGVAGACATVAPDRAQTNSEKADERSVHRGAAVSSVRGPAQTPRIVPHPVEHPVAAVSSSTVRGDRATRCMKLCGEPNRPGSDASPRRPKTGPIPHVHGSSNHLSIIHRDTSSGSRRSTKTWAPMSNW